MASHANGERAVVQSETLMCKSPRFNYARQCIRPPAPGRRDCRESWAQRMCLTMELGGGARMRCPPSKISFLLLICQDSSMQNQHKMCETMAGSILSAFFPMPYSQAYSRTERPCVRRRRCGRKGQSVAPVTLPHPIARSIPITPHGLVPDHTQITRKIVCGQYHMQWLYGVGRGGGGPV